MGIDEQPWTLPVRLDDISQAGRQLHLIADEGVRGAVARLAGVVGISRLEAVFDLSRAGRDAVHVRGTVSATVRQHCVLTLEPVENQVDEPVDLAFTTQASVPARAIDISAAAPEPPEVLADRTLDLGAIATEFLILGIDPYPRKPDVVFEAPASADPAASPFAALAALKKRDVPGK
jgi:uncharacterized metal-binding protein YceD (DUF177 family)